MTLILASASKTRAKMLRDAGVVFEAMPSSVDEDVLKLKMRKEGASPEVIACALAEAKARDVSTRKAGCLVLGADQILALGDESFDKPRDLDDAREQMKRLRGGTHELISAAILVRDGEKVWHGLDEVLMTMRDFSDAFLDDYLTKEGDAVLWSVGGYQIEGRGAQLFECIAGDYSSILGLPLLNVLAALRREGVIPE